MSKRTEKIPYAKKLEAARAFLKSRGITNPKPIFPPVRMPDENVVSIKVKKAAK